MRPIDKLTESAPATIGVKLTEGYVHNSFSVVTSTHDEDAVEYIRADIADRNEENLRSQLAAAMKAYEAATVKREQMRRALELALPYVEKEEEGDNRTMADILVPKIVRAAIQSKDV